MKTEGDQLLLACLRRDGSGLPVERLAGLTVDGWQDLAQVAARHGLVPLLYHTLKPATASAKMPGAVEAQLRTAYLACAARNMRLYHELARVLAAFRDAAIPAILLKGADLAESVYGNIALRPMADADILLKQEDLARASVILLEQGYVASRDDIRCAEEHLPPFRKEGSLQIEVHFTLVGQPFSERLDLDALWQRAQVTSIQGIAALTLSPEDLLMHLCLHAGIHHSFDNGIGPLVDIARTIEYYENGLDWEKLLVRSKQWRASRCVYLLLRAAAGLLGAPVPSHVLRSIMPRHDNLDASAVAEELMFGADLPISTRNAARLFDDSRWSDTLVGLWRCAFPSKQTMTVMNTSGRGAVSLYAAYFSRVRGLLKRHSRTAWRLILRDREMLASVKLADKRNRLKDWLGAEE